MYPSIFKFCVLIFGIVLIVRCNSCPCGKRKITKEDENTKIIGGQLARQNAWPWVVALVYVGSNGEDIQFCGGSLIDNTYVITAAHCVYNILARNQSLSNYQILMGDVKLNGSNIVRYQIDKIKIHPNYNDKTLVHDLALIRLSRKVAFTQSIRPICLRQPPPDSQPFTKRTVAIVVGWGAVKEDGPTVNFQREVRLRIVPAPDCKEMYEKIGVPITPLTMLCATFPQKDSCSGDSGGPLFVRRRPSDIFEQIGIVSFGNRCADKFPGVYTKISAYKNFIQQNTNDAQKC